MKGSHLWRPPVGGLQGNPPQRILKFQVLGNTISAVLRQSKHVLIIKMPFFLHQNITKLHKNDANLHL